MQVLVIAPESMLGTSTDVKITSVGRWSVFGEVIQTLNQIEEGIMSSGRKFIADKCLPSSDLYEACACSREPESCSCAVESCGRPNAASGDNTCLNDHNSRSLIGWLLRRRKVHGRQRGVENGHSLELKERQVLTRSMDKLGVIDWALLGGIAVSFITVVALLILLGFRTLLSG